MYVHGAFSPDASMKFSPNKKPVQATRRTTRSIAFFLFCFVTKSSKLASPRLAFSFVVLSGVIMHVEGSHHTYRRYYCARGRKLVLERVATQWIGRRLNDDGRWLVYSAPAASFFCGIIYTRSCGCGGVRVKLFRESTIDDPHTHTHPIHPSNAPSSRGSSGVISRPARTCRPSRASRRPWPTSRAPAPDGCGRKSGQGINHLVWVLAHGHSYRSTNIKSI